jgi:hypothetical protein
MYIPIHEIVVGVAASSSRRRNVGSSNSRSKGLVVNDRRRLYKERR